MSPFRVAGALLVAGALFTIGCGGAKPEPEIQSSAPQSGYAERYPAELQATATRFTEREEKAKGTSGEMSGYPDQLKDPSWPQVVEVIEQADAAGKSYDYVERVREVEGAAAFFTEHRDEITKKVAGAAQYAAKQKGCEADVSGPAAHALKESVDRELERHLRDRNEAHRTIERYRVALGKENAAALEKQADAVSFASYVVHVDLVEQKLRTRRVMEELETVKGSVDEAIAAEREFQADPKRKPEEKKASEERIEALNKSKAMLESAAEQAKGVAEGMEDRVTAARLTYDEAYRKLRSTLRERAGMPPPPAAEGDSE